MADTYTAEELTVDSVGAIRLQDEAHGIEVWICPSIGNIAFDMRVHGHPILMPPQTAHDPHALSAWKEKPSQAGIPFLAPWANRLSADCYWANEKSYRLNPGASEIRRDANGLPIHGLLLFASDWEITWLRATGAAAEVTSRLEFWRCPGWMAQFPFAHAIEMTHRLADGVLEVRTTIENLSSDPMPLIVGFHPWFQIPGVLRASWKIRVPVTRHYLLSQKLVPTGESNPSELSDPTTLAGRHLDDVFGDVDHSREFAVEADGREISVRFGPRFPIAVVYAPHDRDIICFEPMTGLTNGFNLAHEGLFAGLQSIAPCEKWTESFWIRPSGF